MGPILCVRGIAVRAHVLIVRSARSSPSSLMLDPLSRPGLGPTAENRLRRTFWKGKTREVAFC